MVGKPVLTIHPCCYFSCLPFKGLSNFIQQSIVVKSSAFVLRSQRMAGSWSMPCTTKPEMKLALRPMSLRSSLRGVLTATSWWPITSQQFRSVSSPATRLTWQRYQNICLISLSNNFPYRGPIPKVIDLNRRLIVQSLTEIHHRGFIRLVKELIFRCIHFVCRLSGSTQMAAPWLGRTSWTFCSMWTTSLSRHRTETWWDKAGRAHTHTDKYTVTCSTAQCAVESSLN